MSDYTTTEMIASIKTKAMIPTAQNVYGNTELLRLLNEELVYGILPHIIAVREEYLIEETSSPVVAGTANYPIPPRALGNKLRDIKLQIGSSYRPLSRLEPENIPFRSLSYTFNVINTFYLKNNNVVLVPTPSTSDGNLILTYARRPNTLVLPTACALITSIDTALNQVVVDALPTTMVQDVDIDFISGQTPFTCRAIDQNIDNVSGTTLTFSSLPSTLAVGDYVALAQESPIAQIPQEMHPILTQRVVVKVLEGLGDQAGFSMAKSRLEEMHQAGLTLIDDRTQGKLHKINPEYTPLRLSSRSSRWTAL